jgi:FKBP-type peptidyl-prolyl cis-trans isomerase FklB
MPKGSKWQVYIPEDLAYGAQGAGQMIGPFATLIFDMEMVDIVVDAKATPPKKAE